MRNIIWLILGLALGIVGTGLIQLGWVTPPVMDPGHRLFGVKNEAAAAAVLGAIKLSGGPKAHYAFEVGPTHQVVLADGQRTVIGWFDSQVAHLPPNAMSFAVPDPLKSAEDAAMTLRAASFTANITPVKAGSAMLYIVSTDALLGSALVYRKPWYLLGSPTSRSIPGPR